MTEFKIGDKVRYVNDINQTLIGTVLWVSDKCTITKVEWSDPAITSLVDKSKLCLVETDD